MDNFLIPHTKLNSKWMKDLNVRPETIKILEENTDSNLFDISHHNFLLDMYPEARRKKAKINFWDLIKTVWFWHKNRHIDQWNRIKKNGNEPRTIWSIDL